MFLRCLGESDPLAFMPGRAGGRCRRFRDGVPWKNSALAGAQGYHDCSPSYARSILQKGEKERGNGSCNGQQVSLEKTMPCNRLWRRGYSTIWNVSKLYYMDSAISLDNYDASPESL